MKEKTKKTLKIVIFVILGTVFLLLLPFIQLAMFYITTPKSEVQIRVEKYIKEYNRTCETDDKVRITSYFESGPSKRCYFEFSDGQSHNEASIISFFLKFHNDFGYDYLCNDEIEKDYFTEDGVQIFTLENIEMSYGKRKTVPVELNDKEIDAILFSIGKEFDVDPETVGEFKGTVYVYSIVY